MYSPPLSRKLLPWAYAALFFVVAPALIFYTAGYRYNLKKAAIEKHGTLIADSVPSGADIALDERPSGETTPAAFQELTPGWHRIRFEKPGYTPWEKVLEIKPERVTFADRIHLWRLEPDVRLVREGTVGSLASNPEQDSLAAVAEAGSSTRLLVLHAKGRVSLDIPLPSSSSREAAPRWQEDSRALLLDEPASDDLLVRLADKGATATGTTPGLWDGTDFASFAQAGTTSTLWRWNSRTGTSSHEALPDNVRERLGDFALERTAAPGQGGRDTQLLFDRTFTSKAFSLPGGNWHFGDLSGNTLLLRDGERWLGVNPRQDQPFLGLVEGDAPRWLADADVPTAAFIHGNELWLWRIGSVPTLLLRQTAPLREAAWHASGEAIFFSDGKDLDVIELDERGGRARRTLLSFDAIDDFDVIGKVLYVAGTRAGTRGIWTATVE